MSAQSATCQRHGSGLRAGAEAFGVLPPTQVGAQRNVKQQVCFCWCLEVCSSSVPHQARRDVVLPLCPGCGSSFWAEGTHVRMRHLCDIFMAGGLGARSGAAKHRVGRWSDQVLRPCWRCATIPTGTAPHLACASATLVGAASLPQAPLPARRQPDTSAPMQLPLQSIVFEWPALMLATRKRYCASLVG
eukprot:SAG31_NODE_169_length_21415_cov_29.765338_12_plen_189_part_00